MNCRTTVLVNTTTASAAISVQSVPVICISIENIKSTPERESGTTSQRCLHLPFLRLSAKTPLLRFVRLSCPNLECINMTDVLTSFELISQFDLQFQHHDGCNCENTKKNGSRGCREKGGCRSRACRCQKPPADTLPPPSRLHSKNRRDYYITFFALHYDRLRKDCCVSRNIIHSVFSPTFTFLVSATVVSQALTHCRRGPPRSRYADDKSDRA